MHSKSININEHGQITIPKSFRKVLNSKTIVLQKDTENDNIVKLVPLPDIAGSLSHYNKKEFVEFKEAREKAWDQEINDEFNQK